MYCTIQDVKDVVPEGLLTYLTGGNDNAILKAIENASATINAYTIGSYDPQSASASAFLQHIAERIAVYNLYLVAAADDTPQIVSASYSEAIGDLEKLQRGFISLTDSTQLENARQAEVFSNKDALDRFFPKNGFTGF